jgi:hypothetical protein
MCFEIPLDQKAQHAPGLPSRKWRFAFIDPRKNLPSIQSFKGLLLLAPNGRRYRTIARAESHNRSFAGTFDSGVFYAFVGLADAIDGDKSLGSTNQSPGSKKKRRTYSRKKEVDARCLARYVNGQFYWGNITKVTGCSKNQTYSVRRHKVA